jgi:hypothetical protein
VQELRRGCRQNRRRHDHRSPAELRVKAKYEVFKLIFFVVFWAESFSPFHYIIINF